MIVRQLFAAFVAVALAAPSAAAEPTRDYEVRDGDTCIAIATRELGDPKKVDEIHRLNPGLGPSPHNLKRGQVLKLPVQVITPDAALKAPRGKVEVRQPGNTDWTTGVAEQDLFRSWRVGTREKSSARVAFTDSSTIDMREDTVVVIFGPSSTARQVTRTSLERGVLRSRLAKLDGKPRVAVETPAGAAELTDGSTVIDVDAKGDTKLANHTGAAARLAGKVGRPVAVNAGFGSKVAPGKPPDPPTPLPPAPVWSEPEGLLLGWKDQPIAIRGEWAPVAGASKYRIEIARPETPELAEARLEVPAEIHKLEASELPPAEYQITVATVDEKGLEGLPSSPRKVRVVPLERPATIVVGAEIEVPAGLQCTAGEAAAPTPRVALTRDTDGRARIRCTAGAAAATLELELPPAQVTPAGPSPRVRAGEAFDLELVSVGVAPSVLRATGRGGIEVVSLAPTPRGVRLSLRAGAATREAAVIVSAGAAAAPFATIAIYIDEAPAAAVAGSPRADARRLVPRLAAAGLAGLTRGRRDGNESWIGAEVDVDLWRWVATHLTIAKVLDDGARTEGRLGVTLKPPGEIRPFARLGASYGEDHAGGYAGLGVEIGAAGWLALRFFADGILDGRDARLHAGFGLVLRP
jgi:LysM repeat protein